MHAQESLRFRFTLFKLEKRLSNYVKTRDIYCVFYNRNFPSRGENWQEATDNNFLLKAAGLKANILWINNATEMFMKNPSVENNYDLQVFTVVRRKRNTVLTDKHADTWNFLNWSVR